MSYPNLVTPTSPLPEDEAPSLQADIPSAFVTGQTFPVSAAPGWHEVDAAGDWTQNPLGQSGPFLVIIDEEQILCSEFSDSAVVSVWSAGGSNGRGYNGSTIAAHEATADVFLVSTSAQDAPGGSVDSFNGRSGTVVPGPADYLAVQQGGLTGAVAPTRFVGGTTTGHPVTGTFAVGDFVVTQDATVIICTVAGTPGTWVNAAGSNAAASGTVAGPDTFGESSGPGSAGTYSKGDHHHGLPADPTTDLRASTGATTLIYPEQHATAGAPAYVKGAMYFDTTLNKLRIGGATAWETVTSV